MLGLHVRFSRRSFGAAALAVAPLLAAGAHLAGAADKNAVVLGFVSGLSGEGAEYGRHAVGIGNLFTDMVKAQGGSDGPLLGTVFCRFADSCTCGYAGEHTAVILAALMLATMLLGRDGRSGIADRAIDRRFGWQRSTLETVAEVADRSHAT
jgi:hypothetical protein